MSPVTDKQVYAIKQVEKTLQVKFVGRTKQDAYLWLQEHVPKAKDRYVTQRGVKELSEFGNDTHNQSIGLRAMNLLDAPGTPTLESTKMDIALCHALLNIL